MKYKGLEKLKAYRVTKGSSDGTFASGDIIWVSSNGDINSIQGAGWINPHEVGGATMDFEAENASEYQIIKGNYSEICRQVSR